MALIPSRIRNMFSNRSVQERAGMVLLNISDAKMVAEQASSSFLSGDIKKEIIVAEAVAPQLFTLTTGDGEDPAFRRITSPQTLRDLNPLMHDRMLQVCYFLRVTTPFGKRIVEILTDYIVGKGVRVNAKDERVQAVIQSFWKRNKMDAAIREWADELTTYGELCTPVVVNPVSGEVLMGYVDPMNVDSIQFAEMKTATGTVGITFPYAVRLRREVGEVIQAPIKIVRKIDDPNDPNYGTLAGECFYFAINKAKSASRGFSELFSLADWIDVFDQMMFDFADRVRMLNAWIYHYTIQGGTPQQIQEFKDNLTKQPPRQGGVQVTNDLVKIESKSPDLRGQDMSAAAQTVKLYGLGGAGLPPQFLSDPMDSNKSTAQEMQGPTGKKIENRQNHLGECLTEVIAFQIDCAIRAGVLPENVDREFGIEFPAIMAKDLEKGATTMQGVSASLTTAVEAGWIRVVTAARAFHTVMAEIGVDIEDSEAEFELAQQELAERGSRQQNSFLPQSQIQDALNQLQMPAPKPGTTPEDDQLQQQADNLVQ